MKKLLFFLFLIVTCCSCRTPDVCVTYCNRISVWVEACNYAQDDINSDKCVTHYHQSFLNADKSSKECWTKLVTWIVETGSDKIDCTKKPPQYLKVEEN